MHYPRWKQLFDKLMTPFMYILQGTVWEKPQQTHFWNNQKFPRNRVPRFLYTKGYDIVVPSDPTACERWLGFVPRFHMPIFGGWRRFVVLDIETSGPWFIGWLPDRGRLGLSQIPLYGPVRMTVGPEVTTFFAITPEGKQLKLQQVGRGMIGEAGKFRHVPLL